MRPQANDLPYTVYSNTEETEITPNPETVNEVSQYEELLPNNITIDDVISLPDKKLTNTQLVKPELDNEQKSIPEESQSIISEQKVAPKPDCIETQFGCIEIPQPKNNKTTKEPQSNAKPEANTRVTDCKPEDVAGDSFNKILPVCEKKK